MTVLRARLFELAERERNDELSAERRSQTGGGGRSEKIRTYNFKENRVTDHRIGFTIYRLAEVLAGDLQPVVDALAADERARLLAEGDSSDLTPDRPTSTRRPSVTLVGDAAGRDHRRAIGDRQHARWICEVASAPRRRRVPRRPRRARRRYGW